MNPFHELPSRCLVVIYFTDGLYRVYTESAQVQGEQIKAYQQLVIWDSTMGGWACSVHVQQRRRRKGPQSSEFELNQLLSIGGEWSTSLCLCAIILVEWSAFGVNRAQSKRVAHR